ncbi:hypothetical protein BC834DRAFT_966113 [Gloeopeniophorella convolvens]|nr:hypothetical protein BC834DRAFT_966113 [Gloeopeniophorella convolvens]
MSFDVALRQSPIPPSPASSTSSLEDAVNNPFARVYFGPVQSPEKILIAKAAQKRSTHPSAPVRRSQRLSELNAPGEPPQPLSEIQYDADVASRGEGSGDTATSAAEDAASEDISQDDIESEPASALATKISRAHDNPSPPPEMAQPGEGDEPPSLVSSPRILSSGDDARAGFESTAPEASLPSDAHPPSPSPGSRDGFMTSDHQPAMSPSEVVSGNLIAFDEDDPPVIPAQLSVAVDSFPDLLAPSPIKGVTSFLDIAAAGSSTVSSQALAEHNQASSMGESEGIPPSETAVMPGTSGSPEVAPSYSPHRSPHFSQTSSTAPHVAPAGQENGSTLIDLLPPSTSLPGIGVISTPEKRPLNQLRELGSLSPASEGVLDGLLSTTEAITSTTAITLHDVPASSSVFPINLRNQEVPSTPDRQPSPDQEVNSPIIHNVQRPPPERSPWRTHIANPRSPSKFSFNNTLHDPSRTPARRIPIGQTISHGPASPQKAGSSGMPTTGIFGVPVFTRYAPEERVRSPVRRPPPDPVNHSVASSSRLPKSSVPCSPGKMRSGSEEPQSMRKPLRSTTLTSGSLSDSEFQSPSKTRSLLAFPLRGGLPRTIPEEQAVQLNSPMKSVLRQPSSVTGSRIPRIGAKPYAKPPEKGKEAEQVKTKEPAHKLLLMTRRPTALNSAPTKPVRLVRSTMPSVSGSSSDDLSGPSNSNIASGSHTKPSTLPQPSPSLKRKRSNEEIVSPPTVQPTPMRLVASIPKLQPKPQPIFPVVAPQSGAPTKKARVGYARKVGGDTTSRQRVQSPEAQTAADEPVGVRGRSLTPPTSPPLEPQTAPSAPILSLQPEVSRVAPAPSTVQSPNAIGPNEPQVVASPEPNGAPSNVSVEESSLATARVTRSRRAPQPVYDVFGAVRPLQHRRRATQPPTDDAFSSMSAVALKALTSSNTTKNQHNLVAILETEVIRRPGNRPDSPTTKVRTIEEKRQNEKVMERRERAERRARRSSQLEGDSSIVSEDEDSLPLGPDGQPLRHRRGPGDDEEYQTPQKLERSGKAVGVDEPGESGEDVGAKRVKWDRGLFTTVYFDELPLQSQGHDRPQTPAASKGALASPAKALRLDSLGNLIDATSPLRDLVQENVIIKKFVYDDDAEAAELDAPKPPSKGKGKKLKG